MPMQPAPTFCTCPPRSGAGVRTETWEHQPTCPVRHPLPINHDLACGDTVTTERGLGVISAAPFQPPGAWPDFIQVDLAMPDDANRWSGERRQFHWEDVERVAPGPRDRSFWTGP